MRLYLSDYLSGRFPPIRGCSSSLEMRTWILYKLCNFWVLLSQPGHFLPFVSVLDVWRCRCTHWLHILARSVSISNSRRLQTEFCKYISLVISLTVYLFLSSCNEFPLHSTADDCQYAFNQCCFPPWRGIVELHGKFGSLFIIMAFLLIISPLMIYKNSIVSSFQRFPLFRIAYFVLWTGIFVIFQWILHACKSMW